ncbi:Mitochondrial outer membrane protein iml2 [Orbilia ellipsospora]|uniref:Mitochondrial outer membrane protein iml2 n=1 Tax=Orbilia ellipsospora TaxID=2528407 RepID=A0AAV9WX46_9PEZI
MRAKPPGTTDTITQLIVPLMAGLREVATLSIVTLTTLILATSTILIFTSTILLSDTAVQPIPSRSTDLSIRLDYNWTVTNDIFLDKPGYRAFSYTPIIGNTYWRSNYPIVFPTFAEYSPGTSVAQTPNVSDTGPTVRGFLPFFSSEDRSRLQSYKGKAIVWDSRVVCQQPVITNFKTITKRFNIIAISGNIRRSVPLDIIEDSEPASTYFWCPISNYSVFNKLILCQLSNTDVCDDPASPSPTNKTECPPTNYAGGLKSIFSSDPSKRTPRNGGAYMILNRTSTSDLEGYLDANPEWAEVGTTNKLFYPGIITSLCYTSLDAVDRDVEISSSKLQAERNFASYNFTSGVYNFDAILPQLVPDNSNPEPEARGLFSMVPSEKGWATAGSDGIGSDGPWTPPVSRLDFQHVPFLIDALTLKYRQQVAASADATRDTTTTYQIYGNYTVMLDDDYIEEEITQSTTAYAMAGKSWMNDLFVAAKDHVNGNTAVAFQSLLTVIASNAYYDLVQKLDRSENVTVTTFHNVSSPGGPYGTRRGSNEFSNEQAGLFSDYIRGGFPVGYTIVAVVLAIQIIVAAAIFVKFALETTLTRVGDSWQALAQVNSEDLPALDLFMRLSRKTNSNRSAITKEVAAAGMKKTRVYMHNNNGVSKLKGETLSSSA